MPEKPILIHFDDGYYSNYEYVYPILKKYNAKASIYVVTDKVWKENCWRDNNSKYRVVLISITAVAIFSLAKVSGENVIYWRLFVNK